MPSLSELPGEIKKKKFLRALVRLGFIVNETGGKGSHCKVVWRNQKSVTLPTKLIKQTLKYIIPEITEISGITWEQIEGEM